MDENQSKLYRPEIKGWSDDILPYYEIIAKQLPENAKIAEIGVAYGRSALFMSEQLADINKAITFYCVDWGKCPDVISERQRFANEHNLRQKIEYLQMSSVDAAAAIPDESLDFVFIDADHTYENVLSDIKAWWPKVKPGGIIAGHDYCNETYLSGLAEYVIDPHPDVIRAVDESFPPGSIRHPGKTIWEYTVKKTLKLSIALGIGDNLAARTFFDAIKHDYDFIRISHNSGIIKAYRENDHAYMKFISEFAGMLFTSYPYHFDNGANYPYMSNDGSIYKQLNIVPVKPNLDNILCKGNSININGKYIIITTKIRGFPKEDFLRWSGNLWNILRKISDKYKIVILGERELPLSKEYQNNSDTIYTIYDQIVENLPQDVIIDMSIPSFGDGVPELSRIQQDCLIMKEAEFVITIGIGGNFVLAMTVANTIGLRSIHENECVMDLLNNNKYTNIFLAKIWNDFENKILNFYERK